MAYNGLKTQPPPRRSCKISRNTAVFITFCVLQILVFRFWLWPTYKIIPCISFGWTLNSFYLYNGSTHFLKRKDFYVSWHEWKYISLDFPFFRALETDFPFVTLANIKIPYLRIFKMYPRKKLLPVSQARSF